jgi:DNA-binding response OmpR family regulator
VSSSLQKSKPSVFLLEDDPMILQELCRDLEELGWRVDYIATSIDKARKLALSGVIDLAILDINVDGAPSYPVAEVLQGRGIPLIFVTGFISERIRTGYPDAAILSKPYSFVDLQHTIDQLLKAPAIILTQDSSSAASKPH